MSYALLLLVTGVLYIRPTDLHPMLYDLPLYELLIIPCLIAASPALVGGLSGPVLQERPITICLIGLYLACILSSLVNVGLDSAMDTGSVLAKALLYYLLVAELVNTPARLRWFLYCLTIYFLIGAVLAQLHYHGYISIEVMRITDEKMQLRGEVGEARRLRGTGLFGDPNDVCLNLSCGLMLALYGLGDRRLWILRWIWLVPMVVFTYTISLTQSRGGLLAVMAGLGAFSLGRFGLKKGLLAAAVLVPLPLMLSSGRQSVLETSSGTGQQRIQMAFSAFSMFLGSPLLGVGPDQYHVYEGYVVHNTYVQFLAETGLIGSALFLGAYFHAIWTLIRLRPGSATVVDPEARRARLYVLAMVAAYGGGMLTLSQCYITPTYATMGIATATMRVARTDPPLGGTQFDLGFLARTAVVTMAFLVATFVYTRSAVNW